MIERAAVREDFDRIVVQPAQRGGADMDVDRMLADSLTLCWEDEGRILAIVGFAEVWWPGRFYVWGLLADRIGHKMVTITRSGRRFMENLPHRRIEMTVTAGHEEGFRWAKLLGFQCEGLMRCYGPQGEDCFLFSRVCE